MDIAFTIPQWAVETGLWMFCAWVLLQAIELAVRVYGAWALRDWKFLLPRGGR